MHACLILAALIFSLCHLTAKNGGHKPQRLPPSPYQNIQLFLRNADLMGSKPPSFSAPPEEVTFAGLLFDMDGTLIDSTAAVVKHWQR